MKRVLAVAFLLGVIAAPDVVVAKIKGPVAVTPFHRTGGGRELSRIHMGFPGTITHDLRTSGVEVLEFEQVWAGLQPLKWRDQKVHDPAIAQKVGQDIGAATMLIGNFELDYPERLDIHLRLVDVKSGKVVGEAKAAGRAGQILLTQDKALTTLFGAQYKAPKRPALKDDEEEQKLASAYSSYSGCMVAKGAYRVEILAGALEAYPGFYYARAMLDDVERLARSHAMLGTMKKKTAETKLREMFAGAKTPKEAKDQTYDFFRFLDEDRHQRAAAEIGLRMFYMTWPDPATSETFRQEGLYWRWQSLNDVKNYTDAKKAAQLYLDTFKKGPKRSQADRYLKSRKKEDDKRETKLAKLPKELLDNDRDIAREKLRRCTIPNRHFQWLRAIRECQDYVNEYGGSTDEKIQGYVLEARWTFISSHYEAGRFKDAHVMAQKFFKDEPKYTRDRYLEQRIQNWPIE